MLQVRREAPPSFHLWGVAWSHDITIYRVIAHVWICLVPGWPVHVVRVRLPRG